VTAPNGEPLSPLSCFTLGHLWTGWAHDVEGAVKERWCEREGCDLRQIRHLTAPEIGREHD